MKPSIGRIVHYTLNQADCDRITVLANRPNADSSSPLSNSARPGDIFPAIIVRAWGDTPGSAVNLRVFLDGELTLWATSRTEGDGDGFWHAPVRD